MDGWPNFFVEAEISYLEWGLHIAVVKDTSRKGDEEEAEKKG
jgi:hypothetical protein